MLNNKINDNDPQETEEWTEALRSVIKYEGTERGEFLINQLNQLLYNEKPYSFTKEGLLNTPYVNTIPLAEEPPYPGNLEIETKLSHIIRWNAMAIVLNANKKLSGIGGHIASYLSSAILYDVGYNHFFKGPRSGFSGDAVFFQGHISPGIYSRAYLEGVLTQQNIENFRRELSEGGGLPSYPHPRLLPNFWQFPTVSMGLGPINAIYLARFNKYLTLRGIKKADESNIFCFIGDGETDEIETLGAIHIASREKLDNLIFIINCNLQKLDGPVRGNGKIIQELERTFKGANWNVLKVIWGDKWDPIFEKDHRNVLKNFLEKTVDGEYQRVSSLHGAERRKEYFNKEAEVKKLFDSLSDEELEQLNRGGHDPKKVYAAYDYAVNNKNGRPSVILAKTVKGFGMGDSGEGRNVAHQQKKMSLDSLHSFKERFNIPIPKEQIEATPFYQPKEDSPEIKYLKERRAKMGGFLPHRTTDFEIPKVPSDEVYKKVLSGTEREVSSTMAFVQVLSALLKDKDFSHRIVPIIPDESRTFGLEGLFRQYGIYSPSGQLYTPVDDESLMPYTESKKGQIIEEGINEAGAMATFIAAGTSYSHQQYVMVPFYIFYSMFGFQRTGDLIWAAADMQTKGFLIGGTSGRTTLNGEGLQHEDGHSPILASTVPNIMCYDPAFGYEIAVIVRDGIKRMFIDGQDVFYYLTVYNENYAQPALPATKGIEEQIIKGMYLFQAASKKGLLKANILASGVSVPAAIKAAKILEETYKVNTNIWSVTSYKHLRDDAMACEEWNMLHPEDTPQEAFISKQLKNQDGVYLAVTDYVRAVPESICRYIDGKLYSLGTDGFGRSSSREELREFFEVDVNHIVLGVLYGLLQEKKIKVAEYTKAMKDLKIKKDKSPFSLGDFAIIK